MTWVIHRIPQAMDTELLPLQAPRLSLHLMGHRLHPPSHQILMGLRQAFCIFLGKTLPHLKIWAEKFLLHELKSILNSHQTTLSTAAPSNYGSPTADPVSSSYGSPTAEPATSSYGSPTAEPVSVSIHFWDLRTNSCTYKNLHCTTVVEILYQCDLDFTLEFLSMWSMNK